MAEVDEIIDWPGLKEYDNSFVDGLVNLGEINDNQEKSILQELIVFRRTMAGLISNRVEQTPVPEEHGQVDLLVARYKGSAKDFMHYMNVDWALEIMQDNSALLMLEILDKTDGKQFTKEEIVKMQQQAAERAIKLGEIAKDRVPLIGGQVIERIEKSLEKEEKE